MLGMFCKKARYATVFQSLCVLLTTVCVIKIVLEYTIVHEYRNDGVSINGHSLDLINNRKNNDKLFHSTIGSPQPTSALERQVSTNNNHRLVNSTMASQRPTHGFEPQLMDSVNNTNNNYKFVNSTMKSHQSVSELERPRIHPTNATNNKFDSLEMRAYRKYRLDLERFKLICEAILHWSNITHETDKDRILNRHQFSYSLNSNICNKFSPKVIIFVQSATQNFWKRTLIRRTWAAVNVVKNITFRTVFMLGQTDERTMQHDIEKESSVFGDMVQGNFMDAYKNLTYKHVMALGWITEQCPHVKLIVKVDDDTILNIFNLVDYLSKVKFKPNSLSCSIYSRQEPVRRVSDKWYVNTSTYPFEKYPDYCEGFGYLMSPDVARSLYKASESTKFYWVDDVYVTGILPLKIGLHLTYFLKGHSYIRSSYSRLQVQEALFITSLNKWKFYWNSVLKNSSIPRNMIVEFIAL